MFVSKLSPEQWAEARRLRAGGESYSAIARRFGLSNETVSGRARREGWAEPAGRPPLPAGARKVRRPSPATAEIRAGLGLRLYSVIAFNIRMMELQMQKQLEAYEKGDADPRAPIISKDQFAAFAAVVEQINQVTEMASEPPATADGRRKHTNPELTALSADIDPAGLAVASEKDNLRAELAERLGALFPQS